MPRHKPGGMASHTYRSFASSMTRRGIFKDWFLIRRDLPQARQLTLTFVSFLLPIALWCFVSYVPWIWHPDVKIQISAEREGVTTVFTAGDHVSRKFFPEFVEAVRKDNAVTLAARTAGTPGTGAKRKNQKLLRQLAPLAVSPESLEKRKDDWMKVTRVWYRIADYMADEANLDDVLKILSARVKITPEEYEPFLKGTAILSLADALKRWDTAPGLGTIYGSSTVADKFNLKFKVYEKSQDTAKYLDPSFTKALAAEKAK